MFGTPSILLKEQKRDLKQYDYLSIYRKVICFFVKFLFLLYIQESFLKLLVIHWAKLNPPCKMVVTKYKEDFLWNN